MIVEMYVGCLDNTWYTINVTIPDNTPEDKIGEIAEKKLIKQLKEKEVAFMGVYHIENE